MNSVKPAVLNKAEFAEPIHEKADPRARRADHIRERGLTNSR